VLRRADKRPPHLITEQDPKSPASEAYRALRTNIQFAGLDQPCRTIVVTSATAGEGKTTSVANFGVVAAATRVANLWVVPSGSLPPNPSELVGSRRMREHLAAAAEVYDLVVCDSPPVIAVSDGLALAAQCDGVILTIRVGGVSHQILRRAVGQIEAVKGKILGVVLNGVDTKRDGYYYRYYRYYQAYAEDGRGR
jgi:Mrp family chromosome partitioning ATPase